MDYVGAVLERFKYEGSLFKDGSRLNRATLKNELLKGLASV
jgi:hypothetical protein